LTVSRGPPSFTATTGRAAREWVGRQFSLDAFANKLDEIVRGMLL